MAELLAVFLIGLVLTVAGTTLGYLLLFLLKRTQKREQMDCPNCGKPGGRRATPSGHGATAAAFSIVVLTLLLVCGLPYFILTAAMTASDGRAIDPRSVVVHIVGLVACAGLGWAAIRYVNWYRSFPLVVCGCGWRRPSPEPEVR